VPISGLGNISDVTNWPARMSDVLEVRSGRLLGDDVV
jgi:hypothetical protein